MNDEFDTFLASALAPEDRLPDRQFVSRVQKRIALEEQLTVRHRGALRKTVTDPLAILGLTLGLLWGTQAPGVSEFLAQSSSVPLLVLFAIFTLIAAVLGTGSTNIPIGRLG